MTKKQEECTSGEDICGAVIVSLLIGAIITVAMLGSFGAFENTIDKLGLDEDKIVSAYVKDYYPEYDNCSIKYDNDIDSETKKYSSHIPGVNIYCNVLDNRDGMRVFRETQPTISLELKSVSKEDMLIHFNRQFR